MWLIYRKSIHLTPINMGFLPSLKSLEELGLVGGSGKHFTALVVRGTPKRVCVSWRWPYWTLKGSVRSGEEQGGRWGKCSLLERLLCLEEGLAVA